MKRICILAVFCCISCKGEAKTEVSPAKPAPAKAPEPTAPTAPETSAALEQSLMIAELGIELMAPTCAVLKTSPGYMDGIPPTALLQPKDPDCRALPLMGISIRDAEQDFGPGPAALDFVATLKGTNVVDTKTDDGYRLTYDTRNGDKGLVVARKLGARTINCRGEGNDAESTVVASVCASLKAMTP